MIGAAAGLHLSGAIDIAGLSIETVRGPVRNAAWRSVQDLAVTPLFVPVQGGAILGLAGSL
ncbi:hypothetical protein WME73_19360 [Sorangium sp. So ce302]|uniref:hypothetical protein n=1 Tax=unclassified Sorangium TaxID=2621164 RepID=UPI003F5E01F2